MRFDTTVKDIISQADDVKSFRFPRPTDFVYKPGQFIVITIRSKEHTLTKHFSFSSSPTEKDVIEFTKKLTGHEFSNALDALTVGDWTAIDGPYGNFTFEGEYEKVGMLSGGIGITPLRSMCKYCTDMKLGTSIVLLYGNRTEENIVFREDLEQMQRQNKNLRVVFTLDEPSEGWSGEIGRISVDMLKRMVPDFAKRVFYTCGPPGMVHAMSRLLTHFKIHEQQIRTESFAGY